MRAGVERAGRSDQATGVHHQRALAIDADADIASDLHRGAADFERTPRRAKFTDHQGPLARGSPPPCAVIIAPLSATTSAVPA